MQRDATRSVPLGQTPKMCKNVLNIRNGYIEWAKLPTNPRPVNDISPVYVHIKCGNCPLVHVWSFISRMEFELRQTLTITLKLANLITMPKIYLGSVCQEVQTDNNGKANRNLDWGVSTFLYLQHSRIPLLWDHHCGPEGPLLQS